MNDPFNVLLDSVCFNLLRIYATIFIKDIDLQFPFLVVSFSDFGNRVMLVFKNDFRRVTSSSTFWKSLGGIDINSSLNVS